uniref:Uncharacterized protein n=1 Tax=Rhizophora mucronata TaxID=61149 RepID=A0A2P2QKN1_RHIMU
MQRCALLSKLWSTKFKLVQFLALALHRVVGTCPF